MVGPIELNRLLELRASHLARVATHAASEDAAIRAAKFCDSVVAAWGEKLASGHWRGEEAKNIARYVDEQKREAGYRRRLARYEATLKEKYRDAAGHAWRTVGPDPPLPSRNQ